MKKGGGNMEKYVLASFDCSGHQISSQFVNFTLLYLAIQLWLFGNGLVRRNTPVSQLSGPAL